jgi:hypothetical protein
VLHSALDWAVHVHKKVQGALGPPALDLKLIRCILVTCAVSGVILLIKFANKVFDVVGIQASCVVYVIVVAEKKGICRARPAAVVHDLNVVECLVVKFHVNVVHMLTIGEKTVVFADIIRAELSHIVHCVILV